MAPSIAASRSEVRLRYGLSIDDHAVHHLTLRAMTGADELAVEEAPTPAIGRVRMIGRCASLGDEPLGAGAGRLTLGDAEIVLRAMFALAENMRFEAFVVCGDCGETIVFDVDLRSLAVEPPEPGPTHKLDRWVVRVPTLDDLVAAMPEPDPVAVLATRCGEGVPPAVLGDALARLDPNAETDVALTCPSCGRATVAAIDAWTLLSERTASADELFDDVDAIARAYGWSEDAILALPRARRRRYVALARAV